MPKTIDPRPASWRAPPPPKGTIRYANVICRPTRIPGGVMLVSDEPKRVFFATTAGVLECPRDGELTLEQAAAKGVLIDCNAQIVERAIEALGEAS